MYNIVSSYEKSKLFAPTYKLCVCVHVCACMCVRACVCVCMFVCTQFALHYFCKSTCQPITESMNRQFIKYSSMCNLSARKRNQTVLFWSL